MGAQVSASPPRPLTCSANLSSHLPSKPYRHRSALKGSKGLPAEQVINPSKTGADLRFPLNSGAFQPERSGLPLSQAETSHNAEVPSDVVHDTEGLHAQAKLLIAAGVFFLGS